MQLITYADRLGGDLAGLRELLNDEFRDLFSGVHILPFYDPIDAADAGFDPSDHTCVDPRLGDWQSIKTIATDYDVMADLIVNHMSDESEQFQDVRRLGSASRYWKLFLKRSDLYGDDHDLAQADIEKIYRPRPGIPFTPIKLDDGSTDDFWTTFSANQIDINVETDAGQEYLDSILEKFSTAEIREMRLDAAGYSIKRRGTSCFMLPETFDFIANISDRATRLGIETLVEIHSHYQTQIDIANRVGRVYDFALPPLILHALYTKNSTALQAWLNIAPRNCVTVLDTHDGIGIHDVARQGELDGLLSDEEVDTLVNTIHQKTGESSRRASGHAASNLDVYQVNTTYYDALGRNDTEYLIARALQFFSPGTPQVYYVGLLAGTNDNELVERTDIGRDINRHYYAREEIRAEIERPVVQSLFELMRLRKSLSVFQGVFSIDESTNGELTLRWDMGNDYAQLNVNLNITLAVIDVFIAGHLRRYTINQNLFSEVAIDNAQAGGK